MAEASKRPNDVPSSKTTMSLNALGTLSQDQILRASVGARIQIQTTNPLSPTLEGTLYTACSQSSLLALAIGPASSPAYHVIPISSITSFTILSLLSKSHQDFVPGPLSTVSLVNRANAALARAKERAAKINKNVDKATQDLFDALDKQFSARWRGKDIIVMERVVVKAPGCRIEDCKVITKDGEGLLERVRKVLENERKRAAQREGGKAVRPAVPNIMPAIPAAPGLRKGG